MMIKYEKIAIYTHQIYDKIYLLRMQNVYNRIQQRNYFHKTYKTDGVMVAVQGIANHIRLNSLLIAFISNKIACHLKK